MTSASRRTTTTRLEFLGGIDALVVGGKSEGALDGARIEASGAESRAARRMTTLLVVRLLGWAGVRGGRSARTTAAAAAVAVIPRPSGRASRGRGGGFGLGETAGLVVGPVPITIRGRARLAGAANATIRKAVRCDHEARWLTEECPGHHWNRGSSSSSSARTRTLS